MSRISRFAASWLALIQLYGNPHYDIVCFALSRFLIYFVHRALQPFLSFLNDFTSVTFFPCRVSFCLRRRLLSIIYPFLFLLLFLVCFRFCSFYSFLWFSFNPVCCVLFCLPSFFFWSCFFFFRSHFSFLSCCFSSPLFTSFFSSSFHLFVFAESEGYFYRKLVCVFIIF